jgi:hypothetical protein
MGWGGIHPIFYVGKKPEELLWRLIYCHAEELTLKNTCPENMKILSLSYIILYIKWNHIKVKCVLVVCWQDRTQTPKKYTLILTKILQMGTQTPQKVYCYLTYQILARWDTRTQNKHTVYLSNCGKMGPRHK